jgi:hypothetical protein
LASGIFQKAPKDEIEKGKKASLGFAQILRKRGNLTNAKAQKIRNRLKLSTNNAKTHLAKRQAGSSQS